MASDNEDEDAASNPIGPFEDREACVLHFEGDPKVEDPEALCGWMEDNPDAVAGFDPEAEDIEEFLTSLDDPAAEKVLHNLSVTYVSGVENPAQDSQWVMAKDAAESHGADWGVTAPLVLKADSPPMDEEAEETEEEQKAWAPVLIPNETDKQGDVVPPAEIERAAHEFLAEFRQIDTDHDLLSGKGVPIESWTLKQDTTFTLPDGTESREYPEGTWMLGVQFNDESWERIKSGELTGFSIYGEAENTPVAELLGSGEAEVERSASVSLAKAAESMDKETAASLRARMRKEAEAVDLTEVSKRSASSVCGDLWFNEHESYAEAFGNGSEGKGPEDRPPEAWWNDCVRTIAPSLEASAKALQKAEWEVKAPSYDDVEPDPTEVDNLAEWEPETDWEPLDLEDFGPEADPEDERVYSRFLYSASGFPPEDFDDLNFEVVTPEGTLRLDALRDALAALDLFSGPEEAREEIEKQLIDLAETEWPESEIAQREEPETTEEDKSASTNTSKNMSNEESEAGEETGKNEEESTTEETESMEDMLKSVKDTVEDNNEAVKSVRSRVDTLEERVEDLEKGAGEGEETEETETETEAEGDEATKEDLEDLKEDLKEDAEESAAKAAEEAVKSVLGLDDEDLPEDTEERREVLRKGLMEPGEDGSNGSGQIGFTAEDVTNAVRGGK